MKPTKELVVVLGLIKDSEGRILLTIRRESRLPSAHLKFQIPGGKPKLGEELSKTATRELREETGYIVKIIKKLPLVFNNDWDYGEYIQKTTIHCYECQVIRSSKVQKKMHQEAFWYLPEELNNLELLPGTLEFVKLL